jgi:hypothetical protein
MQAERECKLSTVSILYNFVSTLAAITIVDNYVHLFLGRLELPGEKGGLNQRNRS